MNRTFEKAWGKINLTLDVTGLRQDGYHDLCMVMQSVSLCDDVIVWAEKGSGRVAAKCDNSLIPTDRRNLAVAAAELFLRKAGIKDADVFISITKRVPVSAGMGGGSSDAAAVLRALNKLFSVGADAKTLKAMALEIGSDVPFCVSGGICLAEGRGEVLTALPPLPKCGIVLCKPDFPVSTKELFMAVDSRRENTRPDTQGFISALENGDLREAASRCYNVFEDVLPRGGDEVSQIKAAIADCGALCACMTGTGPTVFGIFRDVYTAQGAARKLSARWRQSYACTPADACSV